MYLSIPVRRPRLVVHAERVPIRWREFIDIQRRTECGGKVRTWDVIVGPFRVIVNSGRP
jgi:hypothetical protein